MNWQELKGLKERRARIGQQATAMVEKITATEKRALNAQENEQFNSLVAEHDRLGKQIDFEEAGRPKSATAAEMRSLIAAGAMDGLESRTQADSGELRALRADESAVQYLETRGADYGDTRMSVGQYIRAAIAGPKNDAERRALQMGSDSSGGFELSTFAAADALDHLRNDSAVIRAGASVLAMDGRNTFARLGTDPVPTWRNEGSAVNVAGSFTRHKYEPKSLVGIVKVTRELLQDAVAADVSITQAVTQAMAAQLDRGALVGEGDEEPLGIANTTGVLSVSMGTNGGSLTSYNALIDATYAVESNGGKVTGVVLSPRESAGMNKFSDTSGQPLRKPPALESVPFYSSTSVPTNGTTGTGTDTSSIFVGDWPKLLIGVTCQMSIQILKERWADTFEYGVLVYFRGDTFVARPKSFAQIVGVLA